MTVRTLGDTLIRLVYVLKKFKMFALCAFSGKCTLDLPFPLAGDFVMLIEFIGIGLSVRGIKVGLISPMGNSEIGQASPRAIFLANDGSM